MDWSAWYRISNGSRELVTERTMEGGGHGHLLCHWVTIPSTSQASLGSAARSGPDSRWIRADTITLVEYTVNCIITMANVPIMEKRMSTAISSTLSTNPGIFCNTALPLEVTRLSRTACTLGTRHLGVQHSLAQAGEGEGREG